MTEPTATATATFVPTSELEAAVERQLAAEATANRLTAELAEAQRVVGVLRESMSTSDDHVRSAIVRFMEDRGVPYDEVNELLIELDLDPIEQEFVVQVKVEAIQYVSVTVSATSADAARDLVNDGDDDVRRLITAEIDGYDWDVEEYAADDVREA